MSSQVNIARDILPGTAHNMHPQANALGNIAAMATQPLPLQKNPDYDLESEDAE
jgi:hypothetical protein